MPSPRKALLVGVRCISGDYCQKGLASRGELTGSPRKPAGGEDRRVCQHLVTARAAPDNFRFWLSAARETAREGSSRDRAREFHGEGLGARRERGGREGGGMRGGDEGMAQMPAAHPSWPTAAAAVPRGTAAVEGEAIVSSLCPTVSFALPCPIRQPT